MKIIAAIFIVLIISLGLFNSYKKYKNELLPKGFLTLHGLLGLFVIFGALYLLFE